MADISYLNSQTCSVTILGTETRVDVKPEAVAAFARRWPGSGMDSRALRFSFHFDKVCGDLVDIWCNKRGWQDSCDDTAVRALSEDAGQFASSQLTAVYGLNGTRHLGWVRRSASSTSAARMLEVQYGRKMSAQYGRVNGCYVWVAKEVR